MITEKCYDYLWSAVIADSTDSLFQVSLALRAPRATDLQPELTKRLLILFPWVKAQGAVTSAVSHSSPLPPPPPIKDRLTRETSETLPCSGMLEGLVTIQRSGEEFNMKWMLTKER